MSPRPAPVEFRAAHRRGAVSIWAIVCLIFVTAIGATLARVALMGSRHMIQERRRSQADWLAQSGWSLALARLQRDAEYKGETWDVPATELGGADAGKVTINVTTPTAETSAGTRDVSIIAEFPAGSDRKVQVTRQRTWRVAKP